MGNLLAKSADSNEEWFPHIHRNPTGFSKLTTLLLLKQQTRAKLAYFIPIPLSLPL